MEKEKIKKGIIDEETKENKEKIVEIEVKSEKENKTEVKKVCEILDLKTETRNIFKMSDGSYRAEIYPVAINDNLNQEIALMAASSEISASDTSVIKLFNYCDEHLNEPIMYTVGNSGNKNSAYRIYFKFSKPQLPLTARIKKAEIVLTQVYSGSDCKEKPLLGLFTANNNNMALGSYIPNDSSELLDYERIKEHIVSEECTETVKYKFDITKAFDAFNNGETESLGLVLKLLEENRSVNDVAVFEGMEKGYDKMPKLNITYESAYGNKSSYKSHTHTLGRLGTASIDLNLGNLSLESEDFAWNGNRMPVIINHFYNSALSNKKYSFDESIGLNIADFGDMNLGLGFRLNLMQSIKYLKNALGVIEYTEEEKNNNFLTKDGYIFTNENGEEIYLKNTGQSACMYPGDCKCYNIYKEINNGEITYNAYTKTLTSGNEDYIFDAKGRLVKIASGRNEKTITYNSFNQISTVTDGVGREFLFAYDENGYLTKITAPDNTEVLYYYTDNHLTKIVYPNGKKAELNYTLNNLTSIILYENNQKTQKTEYEYLNNKVSKVTEYGVENNEFVLGVSTAYEYSSANGRTKVVTTEPADEGTELNQITTVYTFDENDELVSEYAYSKDSGNTAVKGDESGINPHSGENGLGVVSNINNLLLNHNFKSKEKWSELCNNNKDFIFLTQEDYSAFYGYGVAKLFSKTNSTVNNGIYQTTDLLPKGNYTFSAYIKTMGNYSATPNTGAVLRVTETNGNILAVSETVTNTFNNFLRIDAPFNVSEIKNVNVEILVNGKCEIYVNAVQLENNPFLNEYNILENGNFESGTYGWNKTKNVSETENEKFNMKKSLLITGDLTSVCSASQTVNVKKEQGTKETFTLSGWSKGFGLLKKERETLQEPIFRLKAEIKYVGETATESYTADFSSSTEEWQLASVQFSKKQFKQIENITVFAEYGYNYGNAYFDDIQLVRDYIETDLTEEDFKTEEQEDSGNNTDAESSSANSQSSENGKSNSADDFAEAKDPFGNALTETTFKDGEFGSLYRSFEYNDEECGCTNPLGGNNLTAETDNRGFKTTYQVNPVTSRNQTVTNRQGLKTLYTYDDSGRTTSTTVKSKTDEQLSNISYTYNSFDNLTGITRGDGLSYFLKYNAFHNLESIGVAGREKSLITYGYKNGSNRVKQLTYANGDVMKVKYNSSGSVTAEDWYNSQNELTAQYKYVYNGRGNIVIAIDKLANIVYNFYYENEKLVRATESTAVISSDDIITQKTVKASVSYFYDKEGRLTSKKILLPNGKEQEIRLVNEEDKNPVVTYRVNGNLIKSHSKNDTFGRKDFDELQISTGLISRKYSYLNGKVTNEHINSQKLKSSPTTQLVSELRLSNGTVYAYIYDEEERITQITETVNGNTETAKVTKYTYDEQGQLLTETVNNTAVNTVTYDNYGNILSKNGVEYVYGDNTWKDLLTKVGEKPIVYDNQGNPIAYLGNIMRWQKGRQLQRFNGTTYTYNANGIRTSKSIECEKHSYILNGTQILSESWGNNILIPLRDNEDEVCGIIYNENAYYFVKNLQNDIVAIFNEKSEQVAKYTYDAWGVPTIEYDLTDEKIATINPFRYRGYYYDTESGLYYLQSRYYDPKVGRFINADDAKLIILEKGNLLLYCDNDPITNSDDLGYAKYKVGLAVQSPNALNSTVAFNFKTRSAGHAFIELYKNNRRTCARGFLPSSTRTMLVAISRMNFKGKIRDEKNSPKSITAYYNINQSQYNAIHNYLYRKNIPNYNIVSYNCTTFAIGALEKAKIRHK